VSEQRKPLHRSTVNLLLRTYSKAASLPLLAHPHMRVLTTSNRYSVNGIPVLQFGHFQPFITARIVDILGRGGLNHAGVADDVCRSALTEGLGLKLFTHECYQVLAGGTPRSGAPLG
jgi:hypothetical protein